MSKVYKIRHKLRDEMIYYDSYAKEGGVAEYTYIDAAIRTIKRVIIETQREYKFLKKHGYIIDEIKLQQDLDPFNYEIIEYEVAVTQTIPSLWFLDKLQDLDDNL